MLVPVAVFVALGVGAAVVEYSQHTGLMRSAALTDVAQLCAELRAERACPRVLRFPKRAAKDPWEHPYQCRSTLRGLLIYTLGADDKLGGPSRDTDLACATVYSQAETDDVEPCACYVGDEATALLR